MSDVCPDCGMPAHDDDWSECVRLLRERIRALEAVVEALPRCGCGALATRGEGVDVAPRPEWCEGCEAKWRAEFAKEAEAFRRQPGMRVVREEPSADVSYAAALRKLLTPPPAPPGFDANGSPVE